VFRPLVDPAINCSLCVHLPNSSLFQDQYSTSFLHLHSDCSH
jgi:hypothetical protein